MSISIRQLTIKSNVVQRCEGGSGSGTDNAEASEQQMELKEEILEECKNLILAMLEQKGDR